ncbi:MAG: restriction endonuclease [Candidatus Paceibacterota bacterium]|jgi:hypothetical protein
MNELYVTKLSGERELFSEKKLRNALERAAVVPHLIDKAVEYVKAHMRDGIPTSEIYYLAFSYLREREKGSAGRYGLRKAIMELGPDGHPFEKLVGEIFTVQGFDVQTSVVLQGKCVQHEIDVVAIKGDRKIMIECKFHHEQEIKSDVKIALYVQARFEDVKDIHHFTEVWLVTSTKLTYDAIQYAKCAGMNAVGWNYPKEGSLQHLVERAELHPITCLESVSKEEKRMWLDGGIITCKDIKEKPNAFMIANIHEKQRTVILEEIKQLCGQE